MIAPTSPAEDASRARPFANGRSLQVALLAAPAAIVLVLGWQRRWVADDAFINFRVVNELRAGHGLVFNPGERIEAGTSIAWALLLAVVRWVAPLRLEWIAVVLGLAGTVTGIVFAQRGAAELLDDDDRKRLLVPFGTLVVAAIPAVWDFATSGLETGLSFAWLGVTFFLLARLWRAERTRWWVPVAVGFGPVLRPDFALFSAVFGVAMLIAQPERGVAARVRTTAIALALPVAVEIFRMAYYSNLVPNTALAKEAGRADWNQGWQYLHNFATPYLLWLPFLIVMTALASRINVKERGRPGHEKILPREWTAARFAAPGAEVDGADPSGTNFARFALVCGDLRELHRDITGGTGISELWRAFWHAPANMSLRIPPEADKAARKFCG